MELPARQIAVGTGGGRLARRKSGGEGGEPGPQLPEECSPGRSWPLASAFALPPSRRAALCLSPVYFLPLPSFLQGPGLSEPCLPVPGPYLAGLRALGPPCPCQAASWLRHSLMYSISRLFPGNDYVTGIDLATVSSSWGSHGLCGSTAGGQCTLSKETEGTPSVLSSSCRAPFLDPGPFEMTRPDSEPHPPAPLTPAAGAQRLNAPARSGAQWQPLAGCPQPALRGAPTGKGSRMLGL